MPIPVKSVRVSLGPDPQRSEMRQFRRTEMELDFSGSALGYHADIMASTYQQWKLWESSTNKAIQTPAPALGCCKTPVSAQRCGAAPKGGALRCS